MINLVFQSALDPSRDLPNTIYQKFVDVKILLVIINLVTISVAVNIVRTEDEAYQAYFAPYPGMRGFGGTPISASSDLFERFFSGFDDLAALTNEPCVWEDQLSYNLEIIPDPETT